VRDSAKPRSIAIVPRRPTDVGAVAGRENRANSRKDESMLMPLKWPRSRRLLELDDRAEVALYGDQSISGFREGPYVRTG
jgi:hypothetical protein